MSNGVLVAVVAIMAVYFATPVMFLRSKHEEADMLAVFALLIGAIVALPAVGMILDVAA